MSTESRAPQHREFEEAAQSYLRSLPPEHFMEATPQATQRKITLESLDLVHAQRPDVQVFNELLVQYRHGRPPAIRQVVPDNMVVVHGEEIRAVSSFNVPLQPVGPFLVLDYLAKGSTRKDYKDSHDKYEKALKVPYYLVCSTDDQDLTLYRHNKRGYDSVKPNSAGRYAIPELDLELAIQDGWVRYWFRGELLLLPGELLRDLQQARDLLAQVQQRRLALEQERLRAEHAIRQVEHERRRMAAMEQELARLRAQMGMPPR